MMDLYNTPDTPRLLIVADLAYMKDEARLLAAIQALAPLAGDPRTGIQLRAKMLSTMDLTLLAHRVRALVPREALLILNGTPSLAARLGYTGAHVPEAEIPEHRTPTPGWQSAAIHSIEALRHAEQARMDAAIFGSVYAPGSKPGEAAGLDALREVCHAARIPVLAIGGIMPERVAPCIEAGAHGVGVVSGILGASDPATATTQYLQALEDALVSRAATGTEAGA